MQLIILFSTNHYPQTWKYPSKIANIALVPILPISLDR